MAQFIRKIGKANLVNLFPTNDIILSITDTLELFVNNKSGINLKISDLIAVDTKVEFDAKPLIEGKYYFIKDEKDLVYFSDGTKYSIKDAIKTLITELTTTVTTLTNTVTNNKKAADDSIELLNIAVSNLQTTITDGLTALTNALGITNSSVSTLDDKLALLQLSVTNILETLNNIATANTARDNSIATLTEKNQANETSIAGLTESLNTLTLSLTTLTQSVDTAVTVDIPAIQLNTTTNTNKIATIESTLRTKTFNVAYDITDLKVTNVEPEIYIPTYLFSDNDKMFVDYLKIRSNTLGASDITIDLKLVNIEENGALSDTEILYSTITLTAGQYEKKVALDNSMATGLINGYLIPYITNAPLGHPEITLIVGLRTETTVV